MSITALIPAHNEQHSLPATIASLRAQTHPVDRVLVVADNCTDDTEHVARQLGVDVMRTSGNTARKAGALNQALATLPRDGLVLIMDADTQLAPTFVTAALDELRDERVGGVGAVFTAQQPRTYLQLCQYLEWQRYAEETGRTGRTFVMSGTAALIRWTALDSVRARFGHWYDETTITEDSRLSMDLQLCGWQIRSPLACAVTTETMPSWRMLFLQRRRWYLGALQNVTDTGLSRITLPYWRQQLMLALSVGLLWTLLALTAAATITYGPQPPQLAWLAVGAIFATERVLSIWDETWPRRIFAALIIPELTYSLVLQASYLAACWQKITRHTGTWAHIERKAA